MSTLGECGARLTASRSIHSYIRSAASGTVSVLLAKTFRSTTFKLALISIGIFGAIVIALLSYVYWATDSYMYSRSDRVIMADHALLRRTYQSAGRDALVGMIAQRVTADNLAGGRYYLLTDSSFELIAGNLEAWPSTLVGPAGWKTFTVERRTSGAGNRPLLRAMFETLPDGAHLLVGNDISDLQVLADTIKIAFALAIGLM